MLDNNIIRGESKSNGEREDKDDVIRKSDSRVSNNFHQLLVDQKASYVGSVAPVFDIPTKDTLTKLIKDTLGDYFSRTLMRLVIDSSNAGCAWLHIWKDEKENTIQYAIVPPNQVTPIYSDNDLERKMETVRRIYNKLDGETGKEMTFVEFWTEKEAAFFKFESDYKAMQPNNCIAIEDKTALIDIEQTNSFSHGFKNIPFVRFANNLMGTGDLDKYKGLIDVYDDVYNGFVNDVKDVQQVIIVLTNYGGANLDEFMQDLREHRAIKVDNYGGGDNSGVSKLQIDIPVEARNSILEKTKEMIYEQGQGMNPNKVELGNQSGVAMQLLYNPLELKANALQSEYQTSFMEFIHLILQAHGKDRKDLEVIQTWERATIQNWEQKAEMVAKLSDVTSKQNLAKNNPLVEDWQEELKLLEEQDNYELLAGQTTPNQEDPAVES